MSSFDAGLDRGRLAWLVLGVVLAGVIALALFNFIGTLVFSLFVYYASRPVYAHIENYSGHPDVTTTATILVFVIPVVAIVAYGSIVLVQQTADFLQTNQLTGLQSMLEPYVQISQLGDPQSWLDRLREDPGQAIDERARRILQQAVGPITTVASFLYVILSRLFLMFVFVFYLLRDDYKIAAWFRRSFSHDPGVVEFASGVDDDLEHVFFGNLMTIIVTGGIAIAAFFALDYIAPAGTTLYRPILLGFLIAVATLVPVLGMKVVYVPFTILLLVDVFVGGAPLWFPVAFFVVSFVIVDAIPDFFVRSYLSAGTLNMGLILLAYVLGAMAFGWYGLFLGPIVLVTFVHFLREVFPQIVRERHVG